MREDLFSILPGAWESFVWNLRTAHTRTLKLGDEEQITLRMFSEHGKVVSVAIPTDRETGRKRGFAFVEMESQAEAEAAMKALNGQTVEGRQIVVNPSKPKAKSW